MREERGELCIRAQPRVEQRDHPIDALAADAVAQRTQ
jgi:hypothetical protein